MTRLHLILCGCLLTIIVILALVLPGLFKDPRQLVQGEWQEVNNRGYAEVTDCTARWRGSNYKARFRYNWIQSDDEPYTIEVSRNNEKFSIGLTFEDDDHATVDFYIMDKLPHEVQEIIRQKNRARNRPDGELKMQFRRVITEK